MDWTMDNLDWPNRRPLDVELRRERIFHVPTPGERGRPVGATHVFLGLLEEGDIGGYTCYSAHLEGGGPDVHAFDALIDAVERFSPTIVLWQHPGSHSVPREVLRHVKAAGSRPVLGYDEKDPYLYIRKRLPSGGRALARESHHVFLTGAGPLRRRFWLAGARSMSYSPSTGDRSRFDAPLPDSSKRPHDAAMVANRLVSRWSWWPFEPIPGTRDRTRLAELLTELLGDRFALYGEGWDHLASARGPVEFDRQGMAARDAWLSIGWDHLSVPYNFSNRLPTTLLSGVAYLTNRQCGYDALFRDGEHLFMADSVSHAVGLVRQLLSGDRARLVDVGRAGRRWARAHYSTEVIYRRQLEELAHIRTTTMFS